MLEPGPTLKVLVRSKGPLRHYLVLGGGASHAALAEAVARWTRPLLDRIHLVDFAGGIPSFEVGRRRFVPVTTGQWFGAGTIVFGLTGGVESEWSPDARRRVKLARKEGMLARSSDRPSKSDLDAFFALFTPMARTRGLDAPPRAAVERMFAEDAATLVIVEREGRPLVANLTYRSGECGYFLSGAKADDAPRDAGRLAHWQAVDDSRDHGLAWYDLGLVASTSPEDGIYRFKRSLGGTFVAYGCEHVFVPAPLRAIYSSASRIRATWRRVRLRTPSSWPNIKR